MQGGVASDLVHLVSLHVRSKRSLTWRPSTDTIAAVRFNQAGSMIITATELQDVVVVRTTLLVAFQRPAGGVQAQNMEHFMLGSLLDYIDHVAECLSSGQFPTAAPDHGKLLTAPVIPGTVALE